jgi:hypothetical protein
MDAETQIKSNISNTLNSLFLFSPLGIILNTAYPKRGPKHMKRKIGVLTANAAIDGLSFIIGIEMKAIRPKNAVTPTNCAFHLSRLTYFMKPINPKKQTNNRETIITNFSNGEVVTEDEDKDMNPVFPYGANRLLIIV